MFLHRLMLLDNSYVVKEVFVSRLNDHMTRNYRSGYIPNVIDIAREYSMDNFVSMYTSGKRADIPNKNIWRSIVKDSIKRNEVETNIDNLNLGVIPRDS